MALQELSYVHFYEFIWQRNSPSEGRIVNDEEAVHILVLTSLVYRSAIWSICLREDTSMSRSAGGVDEFFMQTTK